MFFLFIDFEWHSVVESAGSACSAVDVACSINGNVVCASSTLALGVSVSKSGVDESGNGGVARVNCVAVALRYALLRHNLQRVALVLLDQADSAVPASLVQIFEGDENVALLSATDPQLHDKLLVFGPQLVVMALGRPESASVSACFGSALHVARAARSLRVPRILALLSLQFLEALLLALALPPAVAESALQGALAFDVPWLQLRRAVRAISDDRSSSPMNTSGPSPPLSRKAALERKRSRDDVQLQVQEGLQAAASGLPERDEDEDAKHLNASAVVIESVGGGGGVLLDQAAAAAAAAAGTSIADPELRGDITVIQQPIRGGGDGGGGGLLRHHLTKKVRLGLGDHDGDGADEEAEDEDEQDDDMMNDEMLVVEEEDDGKLAPMDQVEEPSGRVQLVVSGNGVTGSGNVVGGGADFIDEDAIVDVLDDDAPPASDDSQEGTAREGPDLEIDFEMSEKSYTEVERKSGGGGGGSGGSGASNALTMSRGGTAAASSEGGGGIEPVEHKFVVPQAVRKDGASGGGGVGSLTSAVSQPPASASLVSNGGSNNSGGVGSGVAGSFGGSLNVGSGAGIDAVVGSPISGVDHLAVTSEKKESAAVERDDDVDMDEINALIGDELGDELLI